MKESIRELREAARKYDAAMQRRYTELAAELEDQFGDAMRTHKYIIKQMDRERDAIEMDELPETVDTSGTYCVVVDGMLYTREVDGWQKRSSVT